MKVSANPDATQDYERRGRNRFCPYVVGKPKGIFNIHCIRQGMGVIICLFSKSSKRTRPLPQCVSRLDNIVIEPGGYPS